MNFNQFRHQFRLTQPTRRRAKIRRRDLTIALILCSTIAVVRPATAQSPPPGKAVQTIALKPSEDSATTTIAAPDSHFRLLGYGLFLLPIGLIPWQLSKGHLIRINEES
jgi:hypothetical protein